MPSTILSDNGASSGTAGIKTTGSNDGQLALQTTTAGGTATTALTIDTSQNVGIGVTPSAWNEVSWKTLQVNYGSITGNPDSFVELGANGFWNGSNYIYISTANASRYRQNVGVHSWHTAASGTAGNAITFTQVLAVEKDKSLALQGATSQTGTGITFPATQSASTNANTLDDYEEGTWTPTIQGTSTAGTTTYTLQVGQYTKIGNTVYFNGRVTWSAATGTGNLRLGGLPFASANLTFNCNYSSENLAFTANNVGTLLQVNGSATTAEFYQTPVAGGTLTNVAMDSAATVWFQGFYQV